MSDDLVQHLRAFGANSFMLKAADEIERLRAERDEARQEICIQKCDSLGAVISGSPETPQDYAEERGWDCFKEDTNG